VATTEQWSAEDEVKCVDAAALAGPVGRRLGNPAAVVADWEMRRLGGSLGNPVSGGLYRFAGTAEANGRREPWSLVLKIAQSPANVGESNMGEGDDQRHWNYWRREMLVYQSGILDNLPDGLAAPRCYGAVERPGNYIWLWLEEMVGESRNWALEDFCRAARHFGSFSGRNLQRSQPLDLPWASLDLLRQWVAFPGTYGLTFADPAQPALREHPYFRQLFPSAENPFLGLLRDRERYLNALERLPQTLCHHDAFPPGNVLTRSRADGVVEIVALDWALVGYGPLGAELAQIGLGALDALRGDDQSTVDEAVFAAYVSGLRESGWEGDERLARFGYVATAALRSGLFLLFLLHRAIHRPAGAAEDGGFVSALDAQARALLMWAARAHQLIDQI
jgi:hypothetical protein